MFRGGCIIVMDYSNFSVNPNYFLLTPYFDSLSDFLLQFIVQLDNEQFNFSNGYMFGFSFGAHLAIITARKFGEKRFKEIDGEFEGFVRGFNNEMSFLFAVCDPGE